MAKKIIFEDSYSSAQLEISTDTYKKLIMFKLIDSDDIWFSLDEFKEFLEESTLFYNNIKNKKK
jgi:hypothetical protein